jgi:hypothetical protein
VLPCRKPEKHSDRFDSAYVSEVAVGVSQVAAANGGEGANTTYGRVTYEDVDLPAKRRRLFGWLMIM